MVVVALVLLAETEWLVRPVGGLVTAVEKNIEAVYPGREGGPTLVFSAHYDTATQFGDHFTWSAWVFALGGAVIVGLLVTVLGLVQQRRGVELPWPLRTAAVMTTLVGFGGLAWFFVFGPFVRTPSPGALDNASSVVALLRLADELGNRPPGSRATVRLVFVAAEEEGALGSWVYARGLERDGPLGAFNLEILGTGGPLAYAPEEGFVLRRYAAPEHLVTIVEDAVREEWGKRLLAVPWPSMALSDARSFLAQGIPAITLFSIEDGAFPRGLHSWRDRRERLSTPALDRTVRLLREIVARVDDGRAALPQRGSAT